MLSGPTSAAISSRALRACSSVLSKAVPSGARNRRRNCPASAAGKTSVPRGEPNHHTAAADPARYAGTTIHRSRTSQAAATGPKVLDST
jgi:hypothetical protein